MIHKTAGFRPPCKTYGGAYERFRRRSKQSVDQAKLMNSSQIKYGPLNNVTIVHVIAIPIPN